MDNKPAAPPRPEAALQQIHFSFAPSRVLGTAVQLAFFSHLAAGERSAAEVARSAGATERGTRMILDSLVALELVTKVDGKYALTPVSAQFLVRESPDYIGYMMETDALWEAWSHLTEIVRTGTPHRPVNRREGAEEFFPSLVRGLHVLNREPARRVAEILAAGRGVRGLRVLDVACGSGVWGIAVAEADPEARVTAHDFPPLLDLTRTFVARHGLTGRFDYLPGNLREVDFGEGRFDAAILGNIVHSEGERSSRDLFARLHRALAPGGRLAIVDMVANDDRTGPPFPLFFALNMLAHTEEGDTYTLPEYRQWLTKAGFSRVETADIGSHSPLILASR